MSTRIIYFMYHHTHHCVISREKRLAVSSDSFTLFPLLPAELRLKIWEAVADEPRVVEVTCTPTASHIPEGRWFSHSKAPVIFCVCSESRYIALQKFEVLKFHADQIGIPPSITLYINFASESLHLCGDLQAAWARDLLEKNEQLKEKLRFICVKEILWQDLNQVHLTPVWNPESNVEPPLAVRGGLKALVDVKFHSAIVSMP
ncbi:hypothetical protein ONS95_014517 [Cadophora gregata]|uniref:uncharacterized protein n=1 Tax=Cadophora gregata TaxID=51156 RepID=UPI0026DAEF57|nr:uncharacterized protein ONS95_014517 [Cadophora gregata]KAK0112784.1 hypothetical protein ONS95_014517 [Cadophora gregata]KAK0124963.1 hypothetical protein ONS96_008833 [Cadophora gregata f. sp. sojae]